MHRDRQIIIAEAHVPDAEKTIRPVAIGGIAGGEKFVAQGILFKARGLGMAPRWRTLTRVLASLR